MESIGFTQAAAVSQGTVDAAVDYAVNGPVVLAQAGIETTQIGLDDYLRIPANGLVTNQKTHRRQPESGGAMVRATLVALPTPWTTPTKPLPDALTFVPEAGGDNEAVNRAVFDASLVYWTRTEGAQPGGTTPANGRPPPTSPRIGLVDTLVPAEGMFTNDFLGKLIGDSLSGWFICPCDRPPINQSTNHNHPINHHAHTTPHPRISLPDLRRRATASECLAACQFQCGRGRVCEHFGAERQWQKHVAAHHRRADPAHQWARLV